MISYGMVSAGTLLPVPNGLEDEETARSGIRYCYDQRPHARDDCGTPDDGAPITRGVCGVDGICKGISTCGGFVRIVNLAESSCVQV